MNGLKNIARTIGIILLYLFVISCSDFILLLFGINFYNFSTLLKQIYIIGIEILLIIFLIYIYRDTIIPNFKNYIKNIGKYIKEYSKYWLLSLILMSIANVIINPFTTSDVAGNQQTIVEQLDKFPIYIVIMTVFIAPILEEIVFRLNIRKAFKNDYVFMIGSGVIFGLMHVIGESSLINYLYLIPYSIPGIIFSYTLKKSDNIFVPVSLHLFNNVLSTILLLFL